MNATIRLKPLMVSIAIPLLGGFLSSLLSKDMKSVYQSLTLPSFAPPSWVFGVAWPVLYLLIGIAAYLIWTSDVPEANRIQALTFYGVQLALNFLWSPLFFRFELFQIAFWELCAILVLTVITTACFGMIRKSAAWLMVPYLLWLAYAAALNRAVVALN